MLFMNKATLTLFTHFVFTRLAGQATKTSSYLTVQTSLPPSPQKKRSGTYSTDTARTSSRRRISGGCGAVGTIPLPDGVSRFRINQRNGTSKHTGVVKARPYASSGPLVFFYSSCYVDCIGRSEKKSTMYPDDWMRKFLRPVNY